MPLCKCIPWVILGKALIPEREYPGAFAMHRENALNRLVVHFLDRHRSFGSTWARWAVGMVFRCMVLTLSRTVMLVLQPKRCLTLGVLLLHNQKKSFKIRTQCLVKSLLLTGISLLRVGKEIFLLSEACIPGCVWLIHFPHPIWSVKCLKVTNCSENLSVLNSNCTMKERETWPLTCRSQPVS